MKNLIKTAVRQTMKKPLLLMWFLLLNLGSGQAFAAWNDLLLSPAIKSHKAASSLVLDVAQAGSRLVAVGERGHILYSDDRGESWSQADVPTSVTLTAVFFPSPKMGWAVGHDSVVLHSSDGGESWVKQLDGDKVNDLMVQAAEALVIRKEAELASADQTDADRAADLEYELEDVQFFLKDAKTAKKAGPTRPFLDVWFKNENEGLIVGSFGLIFATSDGGETWVSLLDGIDNPQGFHYNAIVPINGALLMVGEAGTLYRSDDDGNSWERVESGYDGSLFGIVAEPSGDRAVAFGLGGNLVRTSDGGHTWRHEKSPIDAALNGGAILSDNTWVIIAQSGVILVSRDEGNTFTALNTNFGGSVAITDSGDGHIVLAGYQGVHRSALDESDVK